MGQTRSLPRSWTLPADRIGLCTAPQKKQACPCRRAMLTGLSTRVGALCAASVMTLPICPCGVVGLMMGGGKGHKYYSLYPLLLVRRRRSIRRSW